MCVRRSCQYPGRSDSVWGIAKDRDRPAEPFLRCPDLAEGRLHPARGCDRFCPYRHRRSEKIRPGARGRYAAVLADPPFRIFYELGRGFQVSETQKTGRPNSSRPQKPRRRWPCHILQQPYTAIYIRARQSTPDEFRQWRAEVAPISTQRRAGRLSVSVRECPVTIRTRSTSFTGGIEPLHDRH